MNYDYSFTEKEEIVLYNELREIVNSSDYKELRKEYNNLIRQIANNIKKTNIKDSLAILCLLMRDLDSYYHNNNISNNQIDLDILYKLWGSRVCTNNYSNRHLVSFINDILVRSGFLSCKILVDKKEINSELFKNNIYKNIFPNGMLLCLIIDNKRIYIDLDEKQILEYNNVLSNFGYKCYQKIFDKHNDLYFINDTMFNNDIIEVNEDHLFTLNNYYAANEYTKEYYKNKSYILDYIKYYIGLDYNLFDIKDNNNNNNNSSILILNDKLSEKQNMIYKKVKKI